MVDVCTKMRNFFAVPLWIVQYLAQRDVVSNKKKKSAKE